MITFFNVQLMHFTGLHDMPTSGLRSSYRERAGVFVGLHCERTSRLRSLNWCELLRPTFAGGTTGVYTVGLPMPCWSFTCAECADACGMSSTRHTLQFPSSAASEIYAESSDHIRRSELLHSVLAVMHHDPQTSKNNVGGPAPSHRLQCGGFEALT